MSNESVVTESSVSAAVRPGACCIELQEVEQRPVRDLHPFGPARRAGSVNDVSLIAGQRQAGSSASSLRRNAGPIAIDISGASAPPAVANAGVAVSAALAPLNLPAPWPDAARVGRIERT